MPRPPIGSRSATLPAVKPSAANPSAAGRLDYPLGAWQSDGSFKFHSPAAAEQWHADSFLQAAHQRNWMLGRPLGAAESKLAAIGLARSDDTYQGPDGRRYQTTPASREDPHMTVLRAAHLAAGPVKGTATEMGQRASEKALPQALHWMAQGARAEAALPAANDNKAAANENQPPAPESAASRGIGRFAAMAEASAMADHKTPTQGEIAQDADDLVRLAANGLTLDRADKIAAAGNALGSLFTDESYGDAYRRNLADEQRRTAEARERQGLAGAGAEVAPTLLPGYGDALGIAGDLEMYREHPEERNWKNYTLTALGALPFIPPIAGAIKKVDRAIDAAEDGVKTVKESGKAVTQELDEFGIPTKVHTEAEARRQPIGIYNVLERPRGNEAAQKFQREARNARIDPTTDHNIVPAMRFNDPNPRGTGLYKLDNVVERLLDGTIITADAKTKLAIWSLGPQETVKKSLGRLRYALKDNPNVKVEHEFPNLEEAKKLGNFTRRVNLTTSFPLV